MAAAPTVFTTPFPSIWKPAYPDPVDLSQLSSVAAQRINAYADASGAQQDLTLGATSNVRVEAVGQVDLFAGQAGTVNVYDTTVDPTTGARTDTLILNVSADGAKTTVTAGSNALELLPGDAEKTLALGDLIVRDDAANAEVQVTTTSAYASGLHVLRDLKVAGGVQVRDGLSVGADAVVSGNVLSLGDLYGKNYNLYKSSNVGTADALRVGYAFTINDHDQLELLKYGLFSSNDSEVVQKVAVFGTSTLTANVANTASYLAFDALKGIASISSGTGNATPLAQTAAGSTLRDPTLSGTVTISGDVVPDTNVAYDLGTASRRFRDLYLSGSTIDLGGTQISRDPATASVSFVDSVTQSPISIVVDAIQIGTGNGAVSLTSSMAGSMAPLSQTFTSSDAHAPASAKAVGDLYANVSARIAAAGSAAEVSDSTSGTSTTLAASANAVKAVYDLAAAALPAAGGTVSGLLTPAGGIAGLVDGFKSMSTTMPPTANAVNAAWADLTANLRSTVLAIQANVGEVAAVANNALPKSGGGVYGNVTVTGTLNCLTGISTNSTVSAGGAIFCTGALSSAAGIQTNFITRITANGALTNATADAALLTSGILPAARLPGASTLSQGIVRLSDGFSSSSLTVAASANAVKAVYDALSANIASISGTTFTSTGGTVTGNVAVTNGLSVSGNVVCGGNIEHPGFSVPVGTTAMSNYTFTTEGAYGIGAIYSYDRDLNSYINFDALGGYGLSYNGTATATNGVTGAWTQIGAPSPFTLGSYSMAFYDTTNVPAEWYVFGSSNGTTWTQVDHRTTVWSAQAKTLGTVTISSPSGQFAYYRLVFNKTKTNPGTISLAELKWFAPGGARVGVNNVSPAFPLDVIGDVNFTGNLLRNGLPFVSDGFSSTSTVVAASANAVKAVYDVLSSNIATIAGASLLSTGGSVTGNVSIAGGLNVNGWVKQGNGAYFYFHGEDQQIGAEPGTATTTNYRQGPTTYSMTMTSISNVGNMFSSGQNTRVTFPISGVYQLYWNVPVQSISGGMMMLCQVYNSSSTLQRTYKSYTSAPEGVIMSLPVKVNSNDYAVFTLSWGTSSDSCRVNFNYNLYPPYVIVSLLSAT